jgi:hypothetical protein
VQLLTQVGECRAQRFARERHPFAQHERRGLVVQSEREQMHKQLNFIGLYRRLGLIAISLGAARAPGC